MFLAVLQLNNSLPNIGKKKPLLVRNALPEIINILEPSDIMELALDENVTARLIKQKDRDPNQWSVKSSPLLKADFQKMPKLWTLLVQAVDHYSFDLAALWKKFPLFRSGAVMTSWCLMHLRVALSESILTFTMSF